MRRKLAPLGLALLIAAAAAGCGGAKKDASADSSPVPIADSTSAARSSAEEKTAPVEALPDACQLVTKAEAEKLAGVALQDPARTEGSCVYTAPPTSTTAQVEVYLGDGAKRAFDIDRELQHTFEELSGIGDEAYIEDGNVFFRKGSLWVQIRLLRLVDPSEYRKPLEDAARTAASRM